MLELIAVLHVLEAHLLNASWTDALTSLVPKLHRKKKSRAQLRKEAHRKHHRKMHRRAVRHLRHMQKVRSAIRQHHAGATGGAKGAFGVAQMKPGTDMNQDILSMAGAAKQKFQQRVHETRRPKDLATQQQLNALRQRTHASRVRAHARAADVFGAAR